MSVVSNARLLSNKPLNVSDNNAHRRFVELVPHLDQLGELSCRIGYV